MVNKHKGSTFDSFLEEEGLIDHVDAVAIKRIAAYTLEQTMQKEHLNKIEMAEKLHTSRSALDRLLDPMNTSITLNTLIKAMHSVGKRVQFIIA